MTTRRRSLIAPERDEKKACLQLLALRRNVIAWAVRMNTGEMPTEDGKRYIRYGFVGCPDIIGQTVTGKFFAWEVKRQGKKPTGEQQATLHRIVECGGYAGHGTAADLEKYLQTVKDRVEEDQEDDR